MASSQIVLGLTALCFCTWAVSLAGIASIQDKCEPSWGDWLVQFNGFSYNLPCSQLFRYYWFIVSLQFALIVGLGVAAAGGMYSKTRLSWLGLFSVVTLLYISMSDTFLSVQYVSDDQGSIKNRVRTMIAGSIMTATVDCMLLFALGMTPEDAPAAEPAEGKATAV
ncbi:hypothetical protein HYH03_018042 [Edaphochlamys debaryana]|uniref:Uncharacterized protein n=1 Tax=Edaphochlamys debaryana TaxID=47281 RepID=A0A835XGQ1_9CHLO|nr:hypothetical protein HYH03_018042 [Edaphochlamys debaryana]|eukprot:KAG2483059.1 hypothetical protein HYH03_018042 [Edaphochlamys debaryana]